MTTTTKRFNVVRAPGYSAPPAAQHGSSDTLGPGPARVLTDQIKVGVEAVWALVKQAYTQRAWSALGYASWDEYCTREFGTSRLRLPREERAEIVASLRESGLSLRAIASATGLSHEQARRSLPPVTNVTPDAEPIDAVVVEEQVTGDHADIPDNVIGLDGKRYRRENPANRKQPHRRPVRKILMRATATLSGVTMVLNGIDDLVLCVID